MSRADLLRARIHEAIDVCRTLLEDDETADAFDAVVEAVVSSLKAGGKVLLCGNGGSAADAQHLAAELVGRFNEDRRPYPALALSDNIAAVTAVGNDLGYHDVFARAVRALGKTGDILIGLSTSGESRNVVNALVAGRDLGLVTVAIVGRRGSSMEKASEHVLAVAGPNTARIQEGQMLIGHAILELVEQELCSA
jgi:D-sedoheptulose 7-phosphate isomerase